MAEQDVLDKLDDVLNKVADNLERIGEVEAKVVEDKAVQRVCNHCGGDGIKAVVGSEPVSCPDCGGDGVRPFGRITLTTEE